MPAKPKPKPAKSHQIYLTKKGVKWETIADVAEACGNAPVKITGTGLDLQGCTLNGSKLPRPKDVQDESSLPLRINIEGFKLRNGYVKGIPGGILGRHSRHVYSTLVFTDIGEDALSNVMDESPDWMIQHCSFSGASDKSVQMNDARGLTFKGNRIEAGITGVRLQKKGGKYRRPKTWLIEDNEFVGCQTAWNISGEIQVVASGTIYKNVDQKVVANTGATFTEMPA